MCKAQGPGSITYLWRRSSTKNSYPLNPVKESRSVTIDEGTLEFVELRLQHWGYYTCLVKCNDKYVDSQTVKVTAVPQTRKERGQCLFGIQGTSIRYMYSYTGILSIQAQLV